MTKKAPTTAGPHLLTRPATGTPSTVMPVPGVTTVITDTLDKPAIPKWAAKTVGAVRRGPTRMPSKRSAALGETAMVRALAEVPWKRTRRRWRHAGTTIHDIAERLLLDEDVDVPDDLVPVAENLLQVLRRVAHRACARRVRHARKP